MRIWFGLVCVYLFTINDKNKNICIKLQVKDERKKDRKQKHFQPFKYNY